MGTGEYKMTHDFKNALAYIKDVGIEVQDDKVFNSIIAALRIADKLMDEPSEVMKIEGCKAVDSNGGEGTEEQLTSDALVAYKAMRDQMLRELNISTEPVSIPSAADTSQNVEYENG